MASSKRAAAGCGTIRKKVVQRSGKEYVYWEARYSNGFDPGTGKQIQKSISGKTQKEVAQKLKAVTAAIDEGTYVAPCKMTVGQWLDIWTAEYLGAIKPRTVNHYQGVVNYRIKPGLGAVKLDALNPHAIQSYYNSLSKEGLAPKTICDAIMHYIAVINMQESSRVLTPALESVIGSKIALTEDRINRIVFKLGVEVAMMNNILAATHNIDADNMDSLRRYCIEEVATIGGKYKFEDAVKYQQG